MRPIPLPASLSHTILTTQALPNSFHSALAPSPSSALPPPLKILHNRLSSAAANDPEHLLISVVHLLVLGPRWDQREVAGVKVLPLGSARADNGAEAAGGVDECV